MNFKDMAPAGNGIGVPPSMVGKVAIVGHCDFTDAEREMFQVALICIDKRLATHPAPVSDFRINVLLADKDSLEISLADNVSSLAFTVGHYVEAIVYPVGLWRKAKLSQSVILFAMLEELAHAVWRISDENDVKTVVEDLYRIVNPNAKVEALLQRLTIESLLYQAGFPGAQTVNPPDLNRSKEYPSVFAFLVPLIQGRQFLSL